jgi:glycosyltransferase involved in cell wall biosynthesis
MRILLIMDPGIPVPPKLYGGHERLVYLFAEEYIKMGHEVTILAGPGSHCSGKTVTFGINDLNRSKYQRFKEMLFAWKFLWTNRNNFDLIHNFGRLAYLIPILNYPIKKLMTYGRPVARKGIKMVNTRPTRNLVFTACSNYCVSTGNVAGKWKTVYNAIDFSQYQLQEVIAADAPLMFLGRLDKVKGLHHAIKTAKATGNQLLIGGNIPDTPDNYDYYRSEIEPQIDDEQIKYLGPLDDTQKNEYLGLAKALLFPIEWDEPFGMVTVEAMACGTPVIAFKRGAVPEVVSKETGIIVDTTEEMIAAIESVRQIDRKACRQAAQERFDVSVIAAEYLNIFKEAK